MASGCVVTQGWQAVNGNNNEREGLMRNTALPLNMLLLLAVLVAAGCEQAPDKLPVLRIGHAPHDHHAPLYVAAMNPQYFKAHGGVYLEQVVFRKEYRLISGNESVARVLLDSSTGGQELIRRLSEEQYDISFGGLPAMLKYIDKGRPIRVLAPINAEGAALVLHRDINVDDWQGFIDYLKQREQPFRVGYKSAVSVQNLIFEYALTTEGVTFSQSLDDKRSKVLLLDLKGPKNLIPALENGLIDGFVVMQPFPAMAETKGSGKVISLLRDLPPSGEWHGHPCCALAANEPFVRERPEIARMVVALITKARQFIITHPDLAGQQVAKWLETSASVEALSLPTIDFSVDFSEDWQRGMDFWIKAMIESGRITGRVKSAYEQGKLDELVYDRRYYDKAREQLE